MDYQTTLNGSASPARDLKEHVAGMTRDVGHIAELQSRLLLAEWKQARGKLLCAFGCWAIASSICAAAMPIAIGSLGWWLAETTELSVAGGLLCAAAIAVLLASAIGAFGYWQFRRQSSIWNQAKCEVAESLQAVRAAFSSAAMPAGQGYRS
jgi:hypothetical protein